ncbi:hypothetical protein SNOG_05317 [Parastagonospora nodorum SN15]|uniref:Uncharacterized protein n=1 Tax=Phaeosphaeria nodorum (strain SN15 / ATCC MYA-4574 / FGSC 10173) TaxID=321614 RepID=Q0USE7_PHANO|nr:hypothetical protein SNOG_05317 [Parastagonospora nodorum SN15]EAT87708.1 hypothetical protein SNOG_05317 [Parastagonospora nodorum SN15]
MSHKFKWMELVGQTIMSRRFPPQTGDGDQHPRFTENVAGAYSKDGRILVSMLRQLTLLDVAFERSAHDARRRKNTWYMQLADASNTRQLRGETRPDSPKAFKSSGKPSHLISDLLARSHARTLGGCGESPPRAAGLAYQRRVRAVSMHAKMPLLPAILDGGEQSGIARTSTLVTHGKASDEPRLGPIVIDKIVIG